MKRQDFWMVKDLCRELDEIADDLIFRYAEHGEVDSLKEHLELVLWTTLYEMESMYGYDDLTAVIEAQAYGLGLPNEYGYLEELVERLNSGESTDLDRYHFQLAVEQMEMDVIDTAIMESFNPRILDWPPEQFRSVA